MRCKLQPELRCAGCTQTLVHMLTHDTCSLSSIRGRKPRQWTPRLYYTLTSLLVFICWVPQITLTLPHVHKGGHFLRSERLKTFTPSAMSCCPSFFLFYRRALRFQPIRRKVHRTGRTVSSQSMSSKAFWTPNTASSQFVELPEPGSRSESSPNSQQTWFAELLFRFAKLPKLSSLGKSSPN